MAVQNRYRMHAQDAMCESSRSMVASRQRSVEKYTVVSSLGDYQMCVISLFVTFRSVSRLRYHGDIMPKVYSRKSRAQMFNPA